MKILIVSPAFAPDKTVGALRMSSLARYLVAQGHKITVLTDVKDEKSEIEATYAYVKPVLTGNFASQFKKNANCYREAFENVVKKDHYDCVVISGGPFYTFPLTKTAFNYGLPCYLDFRDPWLFDVRSVRQFFNVKNIIRELYYLPKERNAVKYATGIVTVTQGWTKSFKKAYPLAKSKIHLIENGYDDERLAQIQVEQPPQGEKLVLGVFGKLFYYSEKYSNIFLNALSQHISDYKIVQIGTREKNADRLLAEHNLEASVLDSTGFIEYESGMQRLTQVDVCLIIDSRKDAVGTKIYDYIFLNKPILYVGPKKSAIAQMIRELKIGYTCSSEKEIETAFKMLQDGTFNVAMSEQQRLEYGRSFQNEKWLKLLSSAN